MKVVGLLFFLAALYYLGWFLVSGQVGSVIGFVVCLAAGALFFFICTPDAPQKKWFTAKKFGYGWGMPTNWQGWMVYLGYTLSSVLTIVVLTTTTHSVSDALIGLIPTLGLLTATLSAICFKYGESPKWRWGGKDN